MGIVSILQVDKVEMDYTTEKYLRLLNCMLEND